MAGRFFTLSGINTENNSNNNINQNNPENLFFYRNIDQDNNNPYKGFELWQEQEQEQHHQQQQLYPPLPPDGGGGLNVGNNDGPSRSGGVGLVLMKSGTFGGLSCQDCGNQAKKDCSHMRCRTCCKSRGFNCLTHVKSTWIPVAKRRERQQLLLHQPQHKENPQNQTQELLHNTNDQSENVKRLRENSIPSGLAGGHLPAEMSSPAVFRCVRVSSIDDSEDQYAYQTAINIGGHVFKGILYDQGLDSHYLADESSSGCGSGSTTAVHHHLNLITGTTVAATTTTSSTKVAGTGGGNGVSPLFDPTATFPTPINNAYMAGTQFFPPSRS